MRRLPSIATIVIATVFLFAASLPAPAQMRGGGRGAVGGHGGAFAGRGGFRSQMGGGHAFGGMRSGAGFGTHGFNRGSSFRQHGFRGDRFRRDRFRGDRFRDDRFRDRRFRNFGFRDCFGCRRWGGSPWWNAGYYDPYWWWDSGSSYDEDRAREIELANEMNAQSLAEQRMRREQDQDLYARSDPPPQHPDPPPQHAEEQTESTPATVLIFRDERKREVQNYAVVGQTLWVFEPQRTEKIPLSQLDIPATAKANDERGVEFRMPAAGEGQ
jgi:hypothetical protein